MNQEIIKSFIFGATDGIITVFNIISGIEGANLDKLYVIIIGFGTLIADAVSMGVSSYLSSTINSTNFNGAIKNSITTSISFILFGLIPLLSFIIISNNYISNYYISLIASCLSLIVLGCIQGYITNKNLFKTSLTTSSVGMLGALLSYSIANKLSNYIKLHY